MSALDAYAAFLTARWDEQERIAREAGGDRWNAFTEEAPDWENIYFTVERTKDSTMLGDFHGARDAAEHAARHDPAHVLADLAAKRAVLALFVGNLHEKWDDGHEAEKVAAVMLPLLAAPFRNHPDHPANGEG